MKSKDQVLLEEAYKLVYEAKKINTNHKVGGKHWGGIGDDKGNTNYVYVKNVTDAADKTIKTEMIDTRKFNKPGIAKPKNVKKYAKDMIEGKWDWEKSGPIYGDYWKGKYGAFDGNHRLAAAIKAGLKKIPFKNVGDIISKAIKNKKAGKDTEIEGIKIGVKITNK